MPELKIIAGDCDLLPDAPTRTLAVMLFPHDESEQERILTEARQYTYQYADEPVPPTIAKHVWEAGGQVQIKRQGIDGRTAGELLLLIHQLSTYAPTEAGLLKAEHVLIRHYKRKTSNAPSSDGAMRNAWREFKCVSPLWAAYITLPDALERPRRESLGFERETFLNFLSLAQELIDFGKNHVPKLAKATPLLDDDIYTIPSSIALPKGELTLPELSDQTIEDLASYRKDKRGIL